jgi:cytochrome oxidase Cu insertion factor (SCO1/SenC/PrrC family)
MCRAVSFTMTSASRLLSVLAFAAIGTCLNAQGRDRGPLPLEPGDSIPAVSGYSAEGKAFPLEDLKGSYSVVAFGCLT